MNRQLHELETKRSVQGNILRTFQALEQPIMSVLDDKIVKFTNDKFNKLFFKVTREIYNLPPVDLLSKMDALEADCSNELTPQESDQILQLKIFCTYRDYQRPSWVEQSMQASDIANSNEELSLAEILMRGPSFTKGKIFKRLHG